MLFRQALERDLQQTQQVCIKLQQQAMYSEALKYMERCLTLTSELHGPESANAWEARKNVTDLCNMLAMNSLNTGEMNTCYTLLTRGEQLTANKTGAPVDERLRLRAVTLNNLGCYYKKKGRLRSALKCLGKALKIESRLHECKNPADTHLNICACQSQLGRHNEALEHAQAALILLQDELFSSGGGNNDQAPPKERVAVMAIAYHNVAVEQEYLKKYELSIQSYRKALEIAEKHLGPDQGITNVLKDVSVKARHEQVLRSRLRKKAELKAQASGVQTTKWIQEGQHQAERDEAEGTPLSDMVTGDMKRREALNSIAPSNPAKRSGAVSALSGPIRPERQNHSITQELRSSSALDFHSTLPQIV